MLYLILKSQLHYELTFYIKYFYIDRETFCALYAVYDSLLRFSVLNISTAIWTQINISSQILKLLFIYKHFNDLCINVPRPAASRASGTAREKQTVSAHIVTASIVHTEAHTMQIATDTRRSSQLKYLPSNVP